MKFAASQSSHKASLGCLTFFAIPFICVGVGVSWWAASLYQKHLATQSWTEVPATITSAELITHRSKGKRGRETVSYEAVATYDYEVAGRKFSGNRVDLLGQNGTNELEQRAHAETKKHLNDHTPFRCYVNPNDPGESVLFRELPGESLMLLTIFAGVFGAAGFGMLTGAIAISRRSPAPAISNVPDDQPWLLRSDWAAGRILTSSSAIVTGAVIGAIAVYWNVAALPLYRKLFSSFTSDPGGWKWFALFFPLAGLLLVLATIHQVMRHRRFGESELQLASTPGVIGGQLAGVVRVAKRVESADGFRVLLSCIQTTGSGKQKRELNIWQDERLIAQPMYDDATGTTAIPVIFEIPYEGTETSRPKSDRNIRWRLDVTSKLPGVDYKSQFEVPVFKTGDSRPDFQLDSSLVEAYAQAPNEDVILADAGITKEMLPGGIRMNFGMARNLGAAIALTAFLAAWIGGIVFLWSVGSYIMMVILALFSPFILAIVADLWFHRSTVDATPNGLSIKSGLLGFGREKSLAVEELECISTEDGMSSGAAVWKNIVVVPRTGKKITIAKSIPSKLAADAVINELNLALGLDTSLARK
jgi:hypothetical protein